MKKSVLMFTCLFVLFTAKAQVRLVKMIGGDAGDYNMGYGAYIKFSHPISDAADLTLEGGADLMYKKNSSYNPAGAFPIKLGYKYYTNQSGDGLYVEPQAGYNIAGSMNGTDFKGFAWAAGVGFLFPPVVKLQFDLGLRFHSNIYSGGSLNYVSLSLTHNFSLGNKRDD